MSAENNTGPLPVHLVYRQDTDSQYQIITTLQPPNKGYEDIPADAIAVRTTMHYFGMEHLHYGDEGFYDKTAGVRGMWVPEPEPEIVGYVWPDPDTGMWRAWSRVTGTLYNDDGSPDHEGEDAKRLLKWAFQARFIDTDPDLVPGRPARRLDAPSVADRPATTWERMVALVDAGSVSARDHYGLLWSPTWEIWTWANCGPHGDAREIHPSRFVRDLVQAWRTGNER